MVQPLLLAGVAGLLGFASACVAAYVGHKHRVNDLPGWALLLTGIALAPLAAAMPALAMAPQLELGERAGELGALAAVGLAIPALGAVLLGLAWWAKALGAQRLQAEQGEAARAKALAEAEALRAELARAEGATQLQREERARLEVVAAGNEGQWRSLAENAPSLIVTVDPEGRILFANRALPGLGAHSLGASVLRLAPPAQQPQLQALLGKVFAEGMAAGAELEGEGQGQPTWWAVRAGPVRRDGRVVAAVLLLTDITDWKLAETAQREARDRHHQIARLEEMNTYKSQVLDTAAHELGNPLQAIALQFTILRTAGLEGLGERQRAALDAIKRNTDRLKLLVQDMRDLTRIQHGKLRIAPGPVDLEASVQEVVTAAQEQARAASVALEARTAGPIPLMADPARVTQVLSNLVGNAVKFTPPGGVVVVETERVDEAAVVRVRDTGPGLTPEQMARLFQPFSQVHEHKGGEKAKGTGLGLFICKGIVEQHGGRIGVDSEGPGHGCTFWFSLPLTPKPQAALPPPAAIQP